MKDKSILIREYLTKIKSANKELTKKEAFKDLLNRLYAGNLETKSIIDDITLGAEKTIVNIPRKDRLHKGSADTLYNKIIIEYENNLSTSLKHAKEQLAGYLLGEFSTGEGYDFTLIASDFINWKVFAPNVDQLDHLETLREDELQLDEIASASFTLTERNADDFYFWIDCSNYFLKENGKLAFVLPRSFFSADHHDNTRSGKAKGFKLTSAWDLNKVSPLFRIPSCVLFAEKKLFTRKINKEGLAGLELSGSLPAHNYNLNEAIGKLNEEPVTWFYIQQGKSSALSKTNSKNSSKVNPYKKEFKQGATIESRFLFRTALTKKSKGMSSHDRRGLSAQNLNSQYLVLYNALGKDANSVIVNRKDIDLEFLVDYKTYVFYTNELNGAYYLSAILNSSIPNALIKDFQARRLFGARGVEKKILDVYFPKFNEKNKKHLKLALLSEQGHAKAKAYVEANLPKQELSAVHLGRYRSK